MVFSREIKSGDSVGLDGDSSWYPLESELFLECNFEVLMGVTSSGDETPVLVEFCNDVVDVLDCGGGGGGAALFFLLMADILVLFAGRGKVVLS